MKLQDMIISAFAFVAALLLIPYAITWGQGSTHHKNPDPFDSVILVSSVRRWAEMSFNIKAGAGHSLAAYEDKLASGHQMSF